jgi:hypothetical protein
MTERVNWEPGNGTRYNIVYAEHDGWVYFTWLWRGGSGGNTFAFRPGGYIHYNYLSEKMNLSRVGDAAGLLTFLHTKGHDVGMPPGWEGWFREGAIKEKNLDGLLTVH